MTLNIHKLLKSIRKKCLECCNNQVNEVSECKIETCPLYEFNMARKEVHNE